ncbi:bZIP transcription factor [Legionella jordanis]|uniref:BZIP domain-containing protein n=1 Tax=Legionella jordanis TaxID=456 RepID=A0A0W0VE64_9GAMM|nr:bZIP transcription factor [Legionella jordanis]KTD18421.1 hypothetical protein Ljor_2727 [Legionella jordanis]RMX05327.1 hypothetical protein EAW55_01300 [Legionella jordanis]RMX20822.1 hypothetical protein EAS68_05745 [Legionella jordanis]VEH13230.1 Uncharacterised protein [Legionella jordanis]HAT8713584.1 hypothetical protein [Legionella jordanis]
MSKFYDNQIKRQMDLQSFFGESLGKEFSELIHRQRQHLDFFLKSTSPMEAQQQLQAYTFMYQQQQRLLHLSLFSSLMPIYLPDLEAQEIKDALNEKFSKTGIETKNFEPSYQPVFNAEFDDFYQELPAHPFDEELILTSSGSGLPLLELPPAEDCVYPSTLPQYSGSNPLGFFALPSSQPAPVHLPKEQDEEKKCLTNPGEPSRALSANKRLSNREMATEEVLAKMEVLRNKRQKKGLNQEERQTLRRYSNMISARESRERRAKSLENIQGQLAEEVKNRKELEQKNERLFHQLKADVQLLSLLLGTIPETSVAIPAIEKRLAELNAVIEEKLQEDSPRDGLRSDFV